MKSSTLTVIISVIAMALIIFSVLIIPPVFAGTTNETNTTSAENNTSILAYLSVPLLNQTNELPVTYNLTVTSPDSGAMIFLNGNETGNRTPAIFYNLTPGIYNISAEDSNGGFASEVSVNLTKDMNVTLALKYDLTVTSNPENAAIYINGKDTGVKTPGTVSVEPGLVQVQVKDDSGNGSGVQNVLVMNAPVAIPAITLEYDLAVISYPSGCKVILDGENTGQPTPYMTKVQGNIHTIRVENSVNGKSEYRSVNLQNGTTIVFELESFRITSENLEDARNSANTRTGIVIVKSSITDGAAITLNGVSIDTTLSKNDEGIAGSISLPYVIGAVKPGTATVRLQVKNTNLGYSQVSVPVISGVVTLVPFSEALIYLQKYSVESKGFGKNDQYSINGRLAPSSAKIGATTEWQNDIMYVVIKNGSNYISYPYSSVALIGDTALKVEPKSFASQSVYVTSSPEGAQIIVDGFVTDQYTPAKIDGLSEGYHRITLSLPGTYPLEKEVFLTGDVGSVTEVKVGKLEAYANGGLYITTDEPGAAISLYGVSTGDVTPMMYYHFPVGDVKVSVKTKSGATYTEIVTVGADVLTSVNLPKKSVN